MSSQQNIGEAAKAWLQTCPVVTNDMIYMSPVNKDYNRAMVNFNETTEQSLQ